MSTITRSRWSYLFSLFILVAILAACGGSPAAPAPTDSAAPATEAPAEAATSPAGEAAATEAPADEAAMEGEPQQGGTLIVATQADAATLDPHNTGDVPSSMIQVHIYETLLRWTDEGTIGPGLATEWSWSEDETELTMTLKEGVSFHDGSPFNAEAVKANFDRILNPDNALRAAPQLASIESVEAPEEYTVVLKLSDSDGTLQTALAAPLASIISPQAIETFGEDLSLNAVGTGPFTFVRWDTKERLVVAAFENYHDGRPYLDSIEFVPVPEQQARVAMLEAEDAHVAAPVPLQDIPRLESDARFVVDSIATMDNLHLPLNTLQEPLGDLRVRQALNYAIDKQALVDNVYFGYAKPLNDSPLAPAIWGYQPVGEYYTYDVERARALLSEAGYADGFDMIMWIPDGRYVQDRRVGEAVAGYLAEVGVNVDLQTFEWATYVNNLLGGGPEPPPEYGAVMISFAVGTRDADRGLGAIFRCDQWVPGGFNLSFYCNEAFDELMQTGRRSTSPEARLEAYAEAQQIIMEEAPAIFLVAYEFLGAHQANVHGVQLDPNGGVIVRDAWIEQ